MDTNDARKTLVALSNKGRKEAEKIKDQYKDVGNAVEAMFTQTTYDLWKAMEEWEHLLEQKTLFKRVVDQKKVREQTDIELVSYSAKYRRAFKELNAEWINKYFISVIYVSTYINLIWTSIPKPARWQLAHA